MQRILIRGGNLVLFNRIVKRAHLLIEDTKIAKISTALPAKRKIDPCITINAKGSFVSPGFIDLHIHGEPAVIFKNEVRHGTTAIMPEISCASEDELRSSIGAIEEFIKTETAGSNVLGVRIEGAFISRKKRGAQHIGFVQSARRQNGALLMRSCRGLLRIISLAPELQGACSLIRFFKKKGVIVSLGHSDATFNEAVEGIASGIVLATHTFNAMRQIDRKEPGATGAVLIDKRVAAEFILDRIHVHPALFRLLLASKELSKILLVTDSVIAAIPKGAKKIGGVFRLPNGRIAGSALTMNRAIKNAVEIGNLSIPDALRLATVNPAHLLGLAHKKGTLAAGKDADIAIFDKHFNVKTTIIRGRIVYTKR